VRAPPPRSGVEGGLTPWRSRGFWAFSIVAFVVVSWIFSGMFLFGENTTCTNAHGCDDRYCAPCRIVTIGALTNLIGQTSLGGVAVALLRNVRDVRRVGFGWLTIAVVLLVGSMVVATSWSPP
jgi:hypothetical protein